MKKDMMEPSLTPKTNRISFFDMEKFIRICSGFIVDLSEIVEIIK